MSENTNYSVVLVKQGEIAAENRPVPQPGPGEVQVNIKVTGICGSDVHYWVHGAVGEFKVTAPMVLGHESSGVVSALGPGVTNLKVGDRVALEPGVCCRMCEQCKRGRYNLCPEMRFAATPPIDGTLCNYYIHAADFCYKYALITLNLQMPVSFFCQPNSRLLSRLPENVSLGEGALIEPLSVAIHAVNRCNLKAGDRVFVFGAGPVGLLVCAMAKASGAAHVTVADIVPARLEFAKTYYTDAQILLERSAPGEPNIEYSRRTGKRIVEELGGELADTVIDATGAETCVQTSFYVAKNGGTVAFVGMGASLQSLPVAEISAREVDIKGIFRYANTYPRAIKLISSGAISVRQLITHTYPLEEAVQGFERVKSGKDGAIKVQILG
ncbi:chaperonin 10-like protein [Endogone sp. FLAS-F59071]|nr:chaperonin 10-like protein [Endogone sp. FLAS-F59071]|eukprot:RUS16417.1 chaperonin 10-like protein [Endogone sp. FLAS-F59071]